MTYDPDRTNVLPQIPADFPTTDELPIVRPQESSIAFLFKFVALAVVVGMATIGAVLYFSSRNSTQSASTNQDEPVATQVATAPTVPASVGSVPPGEPGYWQVTGVPDGLNVRAEPGTQGEIVGTLRAGERFIFATGATAIVGGGEWKQISFGNADQLGWVSARFLVPDVARSEADSTPTEPTPTPVIVASRTVVCFVGAQSIMRTARIEYVNGTMLSGTIRTGVGAATLVQDVTGTLSRGVAVVELTNSDTEEVIQQTWVFEPAYVDLGDGSTMSVSACS